MKVTISEYAELAQDASGNVMPVAGSRLASNLRTTAGSFPALQPETRFIRLATDTDIHMDTTGGSTTSADDLFFARAPEFIAVLGGEELSIIEA